jgi:hypothetical protein
MDSARKPDDDAGTLLDVGAARGTGVHDLMRAVLLDAILCLHARGGPERQRARLALAARAWMLSPARSWPFSFESICDELGISASYLRTLLLGRRQSRAADADTVDDIVRRLSMVRMCGNRRTRVTAKREYHRRRKGDR